jgi:hypothetical protein
MNEIKKSIELLHKWLKHYGWAGYDPYDIKGTKLLLFLQKNKFTNFGSNLILTRFPMVLRKIFRIKKQINAKAMALFAKGYLNLFKNSGEKEYLENALFCLNWLMENPSDGYTGLCWGYPFDWQSRIFIPKGTPSGVVTSIAGHAFLDAYEILKEDKYLEVANSICKFISHDLNIDYLDENKICFSYTPIDHFHVHNANLFSASILLRNYQYTHDKKYKELGIKALNFTIHYQNKDGSWYYWAPPDKLLYHIDNYHTGFVLENLNIARKVLGNEFGYENELRNGLEYYTKELFLHDGTPKITNKSIYPIDIHSCAQAIITFSELSDFASEYKDFAMKVAKWTIQNMQDKEGYFYYRIYKLFTDRTPYIRWGEAWMLRALSYLAGEEK